jgi:quercetin 2,3-dioxygenase
MMLFRHAVTCGNGTYGPCFRTARADAKKMAPAGYQPITKADIPSVQLAGGGRVRVIAGDYEGARGPAHTFTPITMLDAGLPEGGRLSVQLPATYNAMAVVAKGRVRAGDRVASAGELVLFAQDAPRLELVAEEDTHVILLSGEPLDEPSLPTAHSS